MSKPAVTHSRRYRWGGLLNEVAIVLFLLVTAVTAIRSKRKGSA